MLVFWCWGVVMVSWVKIFVEEYNEVVGCQMCVEIVVECSSIVVMVCSIGIVCSVFDNYVMGKCVILVFVVYVVCVILYFELYMLFVCVEEWFWVDGDVVGWVMLICCFFEVVGL